MTNAPGSPGSSDWVAWHAQYDEPDSRLARRLRTVQAQLQAALDDRAGPLTLISMCAGQGRDVIPVLAQHARGGDMRALLVELDPHNADVARREAAAAGLDRVEVVRADASMSGSYASYVPADIILACGIFGNITLADIQRTVEHISMLAGPGASVIWTRGTFRDGDVTPRIRAWFAAAGYDEVAFDAPADSNYSVGTHRLAAPPRAFEAETRFFTFVR